MTEETSRMTVALIILVIAQLGACLTSRNRLFANSNRRLVEGFLMPTQLSSRKLLLKTLKKLELVWANQIKKVLEGNSTFSKKSDQEARLLAGTDC